VQGVEAADQGDAGDGDRVKVATDGRTRDRKTLRFVSDAWIVALPRHRPSKAGSIFGEEGGTPAGREDGARPIFLGRHRRSDIRWCGSGVGMQPVWRRPVSRRNAWPRSGGCIGDLVGCVPAPIGTAPVAIFRGLDGHL
jgi:hypothetical protein